MNSDNANNEKLDIWSKEKCVYCKGNIKEDSKLLNCLHIICKDCTQEKSTDLGKIKLMFCLFIFCFIRYLKNLKIN